MPLHFPGVDETTFKNLAKRYRKILANKNKTTKQATPSLMQIQEDLVRAMGHKDMHAAQAFWASQQQNADGDHEDFPMTERRMFEGLQRHPDKELRDQAWKDATSAIKKGPDAFKMWVRDNAVMLLNMRDDHPNFSSSHDLLAFAVAEQHTFAVDLIEQLGDRLTFERVSRMMGWEDEWKTRHNKRAEKAPKVALDRLLERLDAKGCQEAILHMGGDYRQYPKLTDAQMASLLRRVGSVEAGEDRGHFMNQIEEHVVGYLRDGHTEVLAAWKQLLNDRSWQLWTGVKGYSELSNRYWSYLLSKGDIAELAEFENLAQPFASIDEAKQLFSHISWDDSFGVQTLHDHRVVAAASSGRIEMLDYVLATSQPTSEALNKAAQVACTQQSDEVLAKIQALGGTIESKYAPHLFRKVLKNINSMSVDECVARLERVIKATNAAIAEVLDYEGGNVFHMMVHDIDMKDNTVKTQELLKRLMTDHGLDINFQDKEGNTAIGRAARFHDDEQSALAIQVLMNAGGDPSASKIHRQSVLPIMRFLNSDNPTAQAVGQRMAQIPNAWNPSQGTRPMATACSLQQAQQAKAFGSELIADDVKSWIQRAFSRRQHGFTGSLTMDPKTLTPMVAWALDHGLTPASPTSYGHTLFHWVACQEGGLEVASLMIERGGDLDAVNSNGKKVRESASEYLRDKLEMMAVARTLTSNTTKKGGRTIKR